MHLFPTNFLLIRIGSHCSNFDKKVRNVVPSASGSVPALNSDINLHISSGKTSALTTTAILLQLILPPQQLFL